MERSPSLTSLWKERLIEVGKKNSLKNLKDFLYYET